MAWEKIYKRQAFIQRVVLKLAAL